MFFYVISVFFNFVIVFFLNVFVVFFGVTSCFVVLFWCFSVFGEEDSVDATPFSLLTLSKQTLGPPFRLADPSMATPQSHTPEARFCCCCCFFLLHEEVPVKNTISTLTRHKCLKYQY